MKVCKYECLLCHNSNNNANFSKTICHITHVDILYLLTLILILKSTAIWVLGFILFWSRDALNMTWTTIVTVANSVALKTLQILVFSF